jgi:magnesium transporter
VIEANVITDGGALETLDPDAVSDAVGEERLVWVDLREPTHEELSTVAQEFSLHPLALEAALESDERPKLERYPTHAFVVLYDADLAKVSMFVGPRWLITVRRPNESGELWTPRGGLDRHGLFETSSVGMLVYEVLDDIIDGYERRIDRIEAVVETLENEILAAEGRSPMPLQGRVLRARRELVAFRRIAVPVRDVVQELRRASSNGNHDPQLDLVLADVLDHLVRVLEQIDAQRELLGNAFETQLALMSNQMNLVMKQLTAWGSIVFGATLVAGIYGMNFQHMPELDWKFGYPLALGLMAVMSIVLHRIFRRRDWL